MEGAGRRVAMLEEFDQRVFQGLIHFEVTFKKNQDGTSRFQAAFIALHK